MPLLGRGQPAGAPTNWGDILSIVGAGLKGISSPGDDSLAQVQQLMAARQQFARQQAFQQQLTDLFSGQGADGQGQAPAIPTMKGPGIDGNPVATPGVPLRPGASPAPAPGGGLTIRDPRLIPLALGAKPAGVDIGPLLQILTANKPSVHVAPDGSTYDESDPAALGKRYAHPTVVGRQVIDENDPSMIGKELPAEVPFGWERTAVGLVPVKGGPADPAYIGQTSLTRRRVTVDNPMPTKPKAAGAAASWLPAGAKVVHLPGS